FMSKSLKEKIKDNKTGVVAIGFNPTPQEITILGSGFCVSDDGKILTAAHLWHQTPESHRNDLKAFVMQEIVKDHFEKYKWVPMTLLQKIDEDDLALFQLSDYKDTLLSKLDLADSDKIDVGDESYLIGFPYAAQLINENFGVSLIANKGIISSVKNFGDR